MTRCTQCPMTARCVGRRARSPSVTGCGKDTVQRIWKARNLRPWQVDTFRLSNDPDFEAKLVDVVGLYLDPPERAMVFSFDEKTQCQATEPVAPALHADVGVVAEPDRGMVLGAQPQGVDEREFQLHL